MAFVTLVSHKAHPEYNQLWRCNMDTCCDRGKCDGSVHLLNDPFLELLFGKVVCVRYINQS